MGISKENCTITTGRIDTYFRKERRAAGSRFPIGWYLSDSDDKVVSENDEEL